MAQTSPCNASSRLFAQSPDPELYFPVAGHGAVWKALRAAIYHGEGGILLTGEPGAGKTMLLLRLQAVGFESMEMAILAEAGQENSIFLRAVLLALDPTRRGDGKEVINRESLLALLEQRASQGHPLLLAVDDAHLLTQKNLETIILISQFRHAGVCPVRILLVGRPETGELLREEPGRLLADGLAANLVLASLSPSEVYQYVQHFLGARKGRPLRLTLGAWLQMMARSQGSPRRINRILRQSIASMGQSSRCTITGRTIRRLCPSGQYRPFPWDLMLFLPWLVTAMVLLFAGGFLAGRLTVPPAVMAQAVPLAAPASPARPVPVEEQVQTRELSGDMAAPVLETPPPADEAPREPAIAQEVIKPRSEPPPAREPAKVVRKAEVPVSERPVRAKGTVYTVQSGSYAKRENAERVRDSLLKKGYPAYMQSVERGDRSFYSIRVDYQQLQTAEKASREIQASENLPVMVLQNVVP